MESPRFLREWIDRMPYHQISELTLWMDAQTDVKKAIEEVIEESLKEMPQTQDLANLQASDWPYF